MGRPHPGCVLLPVFVDDDDLFGVLGRREGYVRGPFLPLQVKHPHPNLLRYKPGIFGNGKLMVKLGNGTVAFHDLGNQQVISFLLNCRVPPGWCLKI